MKNQKNLRKSEEIGSVLKRCVSSYKQEFFSMDKSNNFKGLSSTSDREINMNPILNTHDNIEIINCNIQDNNNIKNFPENKNTDNFISKNNKSNKSNQINKNKKLGSILFQSTIKRNFSPQILKTKIEYNLNYFNKNSTSTKNPQNNNPKTNILNYSKENVLLLNNNGSTKNIFGNLQSINNSIIKDHDLKKMKSN